MIVLTAFSEDHFSVDHECNSEFFLLKEFNTTFNLNKFI